MKEDITFISVCPVCKAKEPIIMPADLIIKDGQTEDIGILCTRCNELLGLYAKKEFPVTRRTALDKELGITHVTPVHAFFRSMCGEGDPHILAFCKELLSSVAKDEEESDAICRTK